MNDYEARKQARIDRYRERAEAARGRSEAAYQASRAIADQIPFGQPILVGHHSERRHRRDLDRIDAGMRKSVAEQDKAAYYEGRARAAESNDAISQDDPDAPDKLRAKLEAIEARQRLMAAINKAWRKAGKPAPDEPEAWKAVAEHPDVQLTEEAMREVRLDFARSINFIAAKQPFPPYALSNNNAEIHRLRQRIERIEKARAALPRSDREVGGVRIVDNAEANRLQVIFPGKPDAEMRAKLKGHGFRWSPREGAWQAYRTHRSEWALTQLFPDLD